MPRTLLAVVLVLGLANVAVAQDVDAEGEASMLEQINALRAESQLAPLARLDALDGVARAHSGEMARTGQLVHVSEATGTPEDRVQGAGLSAARVTENVASHRDTASALAAVLGSPSHRQNVLDPEVTHVGLGAVRSGEGVFVTQLFTGGAAVEPVAPEAVTPEVLQDAAPAPMVEAEAPAAPAAPSFELIPPFFEEAMTQATGAMTGALAPVAPVLEQATALDPTTVLAPEAPAAPPVVAEAAPAPAAAPAAANPAGSLSPAAQSTLRELVGLAQSLLGGVAR